MEEGAVLLKNDNYCLPLKASERSVIFFGNNVKVQVYRTNAGQASYSDKYGGSFKEAFAFALRVALPSLSDVWNGVNFIGGNAALGVTFTAIYLVSAILGLVSSFMGQNK